MRYNIALLPKKVTTYVTWLFLCKVMRYNMRYSLKK